jgi:hypothetical protein
LVDANAWICPFCKGPLKILCHTFLDCDLARILWRSSSWPLITVGFSALPILDLILAILYPVERLSIPKSKARKFQLFASLTLDIIWFSRNKLVHDDHQPVPAKLIKQCSSTLGLHFTLRLGMLLLVPLFGLLWEPMVLKEALMWM